MPQARPLYQGGCGSVWDPEPSKERVGDWGRPATVWSLLCVAETHATRSNGEWGYRVPASNAGPRVPSGGVTLKKRCTYRPSVIYLIVNRPSVIYLIVNKLLSLSLPLSLTQPLVRLVASHLTFDTLLVGSPHDAGTPQLVSLSLSLSLSLPCYPTGRCAYRPSVTS